MSLLVVASLWTMPSWARAFITGVKPLDGTRKVRVADETWSRLCSVRLLAMYPLDFLSIASMASRAGLYDLTTMEISPLRMILR